MEYFQTAWWPVWQYVSVCRYLLQYLPVSASLIETTQSLSVKAIRWLESYNILWDSEHQGSDWQDGVCFFFLSLFFLLFCFFPLTLSSALSLAKIKRLTRPSEMWIYLVFVCVSVEYASTGWRESEKRFPTSFMDYSFFSQFSPSGFNTFWRPSTGT